MQIITRNFQSTNGTPLVVALNANGNHQTFMNYDLLSPMSKSRQDKFIESGLLKLVTVQLPDGSSFRTTKTVPHRFYGGSRRDGCLRP